MTFKELFDKFNKLVFNLALQYVQNREDAEEITQDVFLKIHAKLNTFQQQSDIKTWIYRITINHSLDFIKAQKSRKRWSFFSALSINDEQKKMLLSHSVTPQKDSVAVLAAYALRKKVDYSKWKLLTGQKEEIYNLGRKYYFVEEDLGENRDLNVFLHTENFILIDKNRMIRGIYNGLDPNSIEALAEDIKVLEEE